MKRTLFAQAILLSVATNFPLISVAGEYGLGVALGNDQSTIFLPMRLGEKFLLEPYVRYSKYSDSNEYFIFREWDRESLHIGIGGFMTREVLDSTQVYFGLRLAYVKVKDEYRTELSHRTEEKDGYQISPTIGVTYQVNNRFDVGAEVNWYYRRTKGEGEDNDENYDIESQGSGTGARLILRYYFF